LHTGEYAIYVSSDTLQISQEPDHCDCLSVPMTFLIVQLSSHEECATNAVMITTETPCIHKGQAYDPADHRKASDSSRRLV